MIAVPSARTPTEMRLRSTFPCMLTRSSTINLSTSSATPSPASLLGNKVGKPKDGRRGIRYGYGTLTTRQKGMIIFCVTDTHGFVKRQSQLLQRVAPGR